MNSKLHTIKNTHHFGHRLITFRLWFVGWWLFVKWDSFTMMAIKSSWFSSIRHPMYIACSQLPSDSPPCGWDGELCSDDGGLGTGELAGLGTAGAVVLLSIIVGVYSFRRYTWVFSHGYISKTETLLFPHQLVSPKYINNELTIYTGIPPQLAQIYQQYS